MRIVISILCLSSLFLLSGSIFQILSKPDRVFVNQNKLELYEYINNNIQTQDFIFANHDIGNEIPVWTSNRTITGVGPESIDEQIYLALYQKYIDKTISKDDFEDELNKLEIKVYVLENSENINCNVLFKNNSYLLCRVGDHE